MSDTPRTDSEEESVNMTASENEWRVSDGGWVSSDFARQLERELNEAKAELTEAKSCLGYSVPSDFVPRFGLKCGICEATKHREDELRAEVEAFKQDMQNLSSDESKLVLKNSALRAEVERLKQGCDSATKIANDWEQLCYANSKERDQWRECAERLFGHLRDARAIISTNLDSKYEVNNWGYALAAYERLKGETK